MARLRPVVIPKSALAKVGSVGCTVADWLTATKWKGHLKSDGDIARVKAKAQMLVDAVDGVVRGELGEDPGPLEVREIPASIVTMANDLGP